MFPDSLAGRRVLILGASYREDVGDTRHSPSLALAEMLAEKRAAVEFADPLVDAEICVPLHRDLPATHGFNAVILAVGHKRTAPSTLRHGAAPSGRSCSMPKAC